MPSQEETIKQLTAEITELQEFIAEQKHRNNQRKTLRMYIAKLIRNKETIKNLRSRVAKLEKRIQELETHSNDC
jgi:ubiquinone biosynthesis protein UbiJ